MYEMIMETTCLTFIVAAKTSAPNSFTCEKMKNWPPTAETLRVKASSMNRGWSAQNLKAGTRSLAMSRDAKETTDDSPLTYIIWLYFDMLCSLNSFSSKVEVSPSRARNASSHRKPLKLLPVSFGDSVGPVRRNSVTPTVTTIATSQSRAPYCLRAIAIPHSITGIILKLFPSICTTKDTYFSASYWQVLAYTFESEMIRYFQSDACGMTGSLDRRSMTTEKMTAATRLQKTRKTEKPKSAPS
mmetsp:Transcript_71615/g.197731  ORF Transcript_71615/g.197731 Transcript_71615/m.197731 type:complete len:243 (-) Transcript_71615:213-941(-)